MCRALRRSRRGSRRGLSYCCALDPRFVGNHFLVQKMPDRGRMHVTDPAAMCSTPRIRAGGGDREDPLPMPTKVLVEKGFAIVGFAGAPIGDQVELDYPQST
mmetsp:Transcript_34393/g.78531  ORF Transcript_34393/g.78531 Transcript_34393/m.78531 type:complete len:102 (-) Transcript_34393:37-342(-)